MICFYYSNHIFLPFFSCPTLTNHLESIVFPNHQCLVKMVIYSKITKESLFECVNYVLEKSKDKKRNFLETVELQVGLKNYDPQRDKRFSGTVKLRNIPRPRFKVCILGGKFGCLVWFSFQYLVMWSPQQSTLNSPLFCCRFFITNSYSLPRSIKQINNIVMKRAQTTYHSKVLKI